MTGISSRAYKGNISGMRPRDVSMPITHLQRSVQLRREPQRAMTLIEVLVVISIIGLSAGILLPAIQAARESGRRMQCSASLRQIGLAMNAYHSLHQMFPSSQLLTGSHWTGNCMSELAFLLPHLEMQSLYSSINMTLANSESPAFPSLENRSARRTMVSAFVCPSDPSTHGRNSYRFNRGRFGMHSRGPFDGPFSLLVLPSAATITDGLANTAFTSERVAGTFAQGSGDRIRDVKAAVGLGSTLMSSDAQFIPLCLDSRPDEWLVVSGRYWMYAGFLFTHYNHNGPPNDRRPSCGWNSVQDLNFGLHPPRSRHPGGVNVLFGDGHTSFTKDSVNTAVWIAVGTYGAGDLAPSGTGD